MRKATRPRPTAARSATVAAGTTGTSFQQPVRCAIYTRKSTEEGLEQAFNSLDAQREACAAYIASQRHEGWLLSPELYDDGGFSGGNMNRPGLTALMAEIKAGRINVIVVYKVDRLTRALSDFAKIVEVLDAQGASFVSVTQSFNTTTSMGRLTLNVLLSFAQFEREVTGERIRDKIAASKKKGMWMGGPVPLGYDVRDRKLIVNEAEAATVRHIYARYLALGSVRALLDELDADGVRTKATTSKSGAPRGGIAFTRGSLFHLLGNRVYIGETKHHDRHHPGEHSSIMPAALWDSVQGLRSSNGVARTRDDNIAEPSLLAGLVLDGLGRKMSPSHACKGARRYRYYITHGDTLQPGGPPRWRAPAHDLERIVINGITSWLSSISQYVMHHWPAAEAATIMAAETMATSMVQRLTGGSHVDRKRCLGELVERIELGEVKVLISIRVAAVVEAADPAETIVITQPMTRVRRGDDVRLVVGPSDPAMNRETTLIELMAQARRANAALLTSDAIGLNAIASQHGHSRKHFSRLARLAFLAPDIIADILSGTQPPALNRTRLLAANDLPFCWHAQRQMFGFAVRN
jgi:site-specific DNA recombinase